MKVIKWGAAAAALLVIGIILGAALDGEKAASPGAAVTSATATDATATPTPAAEPRAATSPRKTRAKAKTARTPAPTPKPPTFVACDPNIRAKAGTTTCAFAQNVFYEYWYSWNYLELSAFAAYSAAAGDWFDMTCTESTTINCTADDGSEVHFPMSAVTAYTERNADNYAAAHTVSAAPDDYYAGAAPDAEPEYDAPTPSYGGGGGEDRPDVPYDLDCSDFDGPVTVSPGDPHDLDRDGDGTGCDA